MNQKVRRAVTLWVVVTLAAMLAVLLPQTAYAAAPVMLMKTGYYTGDGNATKAITGVGFQPDVVIVKGDIAKVAYIRTSTMGANESKSMVDAAALVTNRILSFQSDGFTVANTDEVNKSGTTYHWIAFKAAAGELKVGTYTGNLADDRSISGVGFQPDYVIVMSASDDAAVHRFSSMAGDVSNEFDSGTGANLIQALEADGFQVGADLRVNAFSIVYHYIAWKDNSKRVKVGSYTGNGADPRSITGAGFQPEYVIVQASVKDAYHKPNSTGAGTDASFKFKANVLETNRIQALESDGFQVGSQDFVNLSGTTYYYICFNQVSWDSYSDSDHHAQLDYFDQYPAENTVYMYGNGFDASTVYRVVFWDWVDPNWVNRETEDPTSDSNGNLGAAHSLASGTDTEGNWHCVVYYDTSHSPTTYDPNDSKLAADDLTYTGGYAFYVAAAAIPEFPTIMAGIAVAGLCFGIYYWMRRRRVYGVQRVG